jgi:hypothetical protein
VRAAQAIWCEPHGQFSALQKSKINQKNKLQ